ncbi:hypothetical protein ACFQGE_11625 [Halomicroarcula sp. GCM10025817]|uniref:hypothetical protein n=1 Tax=Haloarcula TaxID=2237 RepID=UPI0023E8745D|nr:hypothetical protein [Halomicroarcula sp. SYNS111]
MTEVVIDCTEQTRTGSSYACDRLDEEYPEWANRYVDIRGGTGSRDGQATSETLTETRRDVQQLSRQVKQFRELEAEYEEAKAAGNDQRVRALAHQLVEQSRRINKTGTRASADYDSFAETTSSNLTVASEAVTDIQTNTTRRAAAVREEELVGTRLTATATDDSGSFASPLVIEGRLTDENGSALAQQDVRFRIGNQTVTTELDPDGRFSTSFRPVAEQIGDQQLSVTYLPSNTSLYARSSDKVSVTLEEAEATVSLSADPAVVVFGDTVRASGRVAVEEQGVSDVPVVVSLGGQRLGVVRTGDDGFYSLTAPLPPAVSPGDSRVTAGLPFDSRALAFEDATATVRVASTPTTVTLNGTRVAPRVVLVRGTVRADRRPVADRRVEVSQNGRVLTAVRTGPDGQFETNLSLPATVSGRDSVVVTAAHLAEGGNLQPDRTQVTLAPTSESPGSLIESLVQNPLSVVFGQSSAAGGAPVDGASERLTLLVRFGALVLGLLGVGLVWRLFGGRPWTLEWPSRVQALLPWLNSQPVETGLSEDSSEDSSATEGTPEAGQSPAETIDLLAVARNRLAAGETDEAVLMGYEAVRTTLINRLNRDASMTHWELLRAYAGGRANERVAALRELTEAYERSAFSLESSSIESTKAALASATYLLEDQEGSNEQNRSDSVSD